MDEDRIDSYDLTKVGRTSISELRYADDTDKEFLLMFCCHIKFWLLYISFQLQREPPTKQYFIYIPKCFPS